MFVLNDYHQYSFNHFINHSIYDFINDCVNILSKGWNYAFIFQSIVLKPMSLKLGFINLTSTIFQKVFIINTGENGFLQKWLK